MSRGVASVDERFSSSCTAVSACIVSVRPHSLLSLRGQQRLEPGGAVAEFRSNTIVTAVVRLFFPYGDFNEFIDGALIHMRETCWDSLKVERDDWV